MEDDISSEVVEKISVFPKATNQKEAQAFLWNGRVLTNAHSWIQSASKTTVNGGVSKTGLCGDLRNSKAFNK